MQNSNSEEKLRKYKLNGSGSGGGGSVEELDEKEQSERLILNKQNNNIELTTFGKQNKPMPTMTTAKANNWRYTLENILDFNLKFSSHSLESFYKKSYLPVTRLLFCHYLVYLLVLLIAWIVFFLIAQDSSASSGLVGELFSYKELESNGSSIYEHIDRIYIYLGAQYASNSYMIVLVYMSVIACILLTMLVALLFVEYKESNYRYLEKELKENENNTKVDCKIAERDLKKAMKDVLKKEKEYSSLTELLNLKYEKINKSREIYSKIANPSALFVVACFFALCFISFAFPPRSLSPISHFVWFCETLLLAYLIYPFHMSVSLVLGIFFSILFEILAIGKQIDLFSDETSAPPRHNEYESSQLTIFILSKILLHASVHLCGSYLKLSMQAIKRDTFLKVAHMHKANMASQEDKEITERMIKSIMPPLFTHVFGKPEEFKKSVNCVHQMRPLFIYPVSELSILYADIVGFTRMSSTKTAEQLVFLLNDLYGRFDKLCEKTNCEKISTLGDCYYCVSGCLNGREDHAKCCVEMGLLMIKEIESFNKVHSVDVNMRVGVHTGNALCGFIGGKRFRFDVWSSDVTLANKMESSGRPGAVHISQDTYAHLKDTTTSSYNIETGDLYSGKQTYFVKHEQKKETVADALKQCYANLENSNSPHPQQIAELTGSDKTNNIFQKFDSNALDSSRNAISQNLENNDDSSFTGNSSTSGKGGKDNTITSEDGLLLLALKNAQFFHPDLNLFSMRFKSNEEKRYQAYLIGHQSNTNSSGTTVIKGIDAIKTMWTNPQNTLCMNILVSFIINLCVCTAYFLSFVASSMSTCAYKLGKVYKTDMIIILCLFLLIFLSEAAFLVVYLFSCSNLIGKNKKNQQGLFDFLPHDKHEQQQQQQSTNHYRSYSNSLSSSRSNDRHISIRYMLLHIISILFLCIIPVFLISTFIPILGHMLDSSFELTESNNTAIAACFLDNTNRSLNIFSVYAFFAFTVLLIHFCSFFQLSSLLKTLVALGFALLFGVLSFSGVYTHLGGQRVNDLFELESIETTYFSQPGRVMNEDMDPSVVNPNIKNITIISFNLYSTLFLTSFLGENAIALLDLGMLIALIWLINRQSELILRLSFKCDQNALRKVTYAKEQKELANWLIEVVLPSHVVSHVQQKKQYSRNYDCVGVLFVSLCNFGEFFEETYEGGRELLRVLNEITVDFDRLFDEPKYKNVEKIKSIGSTFMIASGLSHEKNTEENKNNISHLYDLIDFALELSEKLDAFNNEAMSVCHFKFKMTMGFNCGPVTAGVIGTERLLYDIWGDTVNVASRMDSTGQAGFLQTTEETTKIFGNNYNFIYRGSVNIKGKDSMTTYFMDPKLNKKFNS